MFHIELIEMEGKLIGVVSLLPACGFQGTEFSSALWAISLVQGQMLYRLMRLCLGAPVANSFPTQHEEFQYDALDVHFPWYSRSYI